MKFHVLITVLVISSTFAVSKDNSDISQVPAWAKQAVWYQIFPERFRNGSSIDDPHLNDLTGSWPHDTPAEWHISPWTSDWYKTQPWEKSDTQGFYHFVQRRRYGGDLQGIIKKLDYLADLGVTAIYLNPIFQSPSLHKYDASMYHHVDKNLGPDPDGDRARWVKEDPSDPSTWGWTSADKLFLKLIHEVHRRHMKIIIDGVFNHVGMTFWALEDVRKHQQQSKFKDWFTITSWDDPSTPSDEFSYKGWFDVRELPALRKDDSTGMADGPKQHIHAIVRRWMSPNGNPKDGIDGWRLDAADMVPFPFWRDFRSWVREINPDAFLTGEVWWEDWKNDKMFNAAPWLKGDVFDAVMNYRWAREVCHFFVDHKNAISPSEFDRRLEQLRKDYRSDATAVMMNLLDSHDTDRLSSRIVNPDLLYDHNVGLHDNTSYDARKPNADELQIQKLMVLFQMTYIGAPMVYYGDEAGMWGGDDPDCRKPMLWEDLKYENESSHPFGSERPEDHNVFNRQLYTYYRTLIHLRRVHPSLSLGEFATVKTDDERSILAFKRSTADETAVIIINNSTVPQRIAKKDFALAKLKIVFASVATPTSMKSSFIELKPKSGIIFAGRTM